MYNYFTAVMTIGVLTFLALYTTHFIQIVTLGGVLAEKKNKRTAGNKKEIFRINRCNNDDIIKPASAFRMRWSQHSTKEKTI